jgi:crotonobetainyl-CoA:carnitine CoA-transferase CaiB-like acyl-CoA transferase
MGRFGPAYETRAADNPKLVYAAVHGFGDPRLREHNAEVLTGFGLRKL